MTERPSNGRTQRAELQPVAGSQLRGCRPIFSTHTKVAFTEDHGYGAANRIGGERRLAGQPHLNDASSSQVFPNKARRQSGRIVRDHQIAGLEAFRQPGSGSVR
jgi:hypothetical protein